MQLNHHLTAVLSTHKTGPAEGKVRVQWSISAGLGAICSAVVALVTVTALHPSMRHCFALGWLLETQAIAQGDRAGV